MASFDQSSTGYGYVARVREVVDSSRVYIQLPNGSLGWADMQPPLDFKKDDVVLVFNDHIEHAPVELWHEEPLVSVVRIKSDEFTILEYAGQIRKIPTNNIDYTKDNTVEFLSTGVIRVLDTMPLSLLELPDISNSVIEGFKVPAVTGFETFADFGGLPDVIARARKLVETPLIYGEQLGEIGAPQARGVLFIGEPGTGKTMLARIVARESGATLYQVNGPEIVSKWLGQSEELLRRIFERAQLEPKAIIFFDEIDSIAEERRDESHEASRRLVAQLLTLMDSCNRANAGNVIVIGTTNRPNALEPALRRPGRFDWEIYFPLPDRDGREQILKASSRKLRVADDLPHEKIANVTDSWTPAELAEIWKEAALLAVTDGRSVIMAEDYIGGFQWVNSLKMRTKEYE